MVEEGTPAIPTPPHRLHDVETVEITIIEIVIQDITTLSLPAVVTLHAVIHRDVTLHIVMNRDATHCLATTLHVATIPVVIHRQGVLTATTATIITTTTTITIDVLALTRLDVATSFLLEQEEELTQRVEFPYNYIYICYQSEILQLWQRFMNTLYLQLMHHCKSQLICATIHIES